MNSPGQSRRRSKRILIGVGLLILLLAALGSFTISQLEGLSNTAIELYNHPLQVSRSLASIESGVHAIHRTMKDVALADSDTVRESKLHDIETYVAEIHRHFALVTGNYLGDPGQVTYAWSLFKTWPEIRSQVLSLSEEGRNQEAYDITRGIGADHVDRIVDSIEPMSAFADSKAREFLQRAEEQRNLTLVLIITAFLVSTILSLTVFAMTIRAARENERQLESLFTYALDGISATDSNGRLIQVNPALCRMTGYDLRELIGTGPDLPFWPEDQKETIRKALKNVDQEEAGSREVVYCRKNGERFPVILSSSNLFNAKDDNRSRVDIVKDITERKRAEEQQRLMTSRYQELAQKVERIREEERSAVSRDLHDDLGQILTALMFSIGGLKQLQGDLPDSAVQILADMEKLVTTSIETIRKLVSTLRPGLLDNLGLVPALSWFLKEMEERTGLVTRFEPEPGLTINNREFETVLYRVAQEATTNILRHARASHLEIKLEQSDKLLRMSVEDDGIGIRPDEENSPGSLGILGMHERLRPLHGNLEITGKPDHGTRLVASIPLD